MGSDLRELNDQRRKATVLDDGRTRRHLLLALPKVAVRVIRKHFKRSPASRHDLRTTDDTNRDHFLTAAAVAAAKTPEGAIHRSRRSADRATSPGPREGTSEGGRRALAIPRRHQSNEGASCAQIRRYEVVWTKSRKCERRRQTKRTRVFGENRARGPIEAEGADSAVCLA
uniref:Uncharacterized protein n=1 Tax=Steinernema glaseri TaxID=37863 RepID=A0A1I7XWG2_9BILA